jgi:DNA topoisomerase-1
LQQINFEKLRNEKIECERIPPNYGVVKINGKKYKLTNYIVEPLHIFKGRGDHPLRGTLKLPVSPEQITLNAANNPPCVVKGRVWGNVINNSSLQWAGFYKDSLGQSKYMYPLLNDEFSKFETARKLHKKLHSIRKQYTHDLHSEKLNIKQKATATYFIDKLCIRVGHPKESDSADTVGCCTLRVEHIKLNGQSISFCFLGKDSIEFRKTIVPNDIVLPNVKDFIKNKKNNDLVFCKIDASILNTYLNKLQRGLTAKQFRTCHASSKFDNLLRSYNPAIDGNIVKYYKLSNSKVAKLCNHKKGNLLSNETSKANYIDPRITYAFCKRNNLDISMFFSPTLIEKHSWAKNTQSDFKF